MFCLHVNRYNLQHEKKRRTTLTLGKLHSQWLLQERKSTVHCQAAFFFGIREKNTNLIVIKRLIVTFYYTSRINKPKNQFIPFIPPRNPLPLR